jgi:alpha-1,3-rhamnosyl/mannosyltransferase
MAERDRVDVYWGTNFVLPIGLSHRIPAVVTVYDLVPFFFPSTMEFRNLVKLRLLMRASLKRARHVVTISEAVRQDLHRVFGVALDRISVVPPGVGTQFGLQPGGAKSPTSTPGLDGPYLLAVGTIEPRKNLPTLIRAYSALPAAFRRRYPLAVVGAAGWKNAAIHALAEPLVHEGTVRFLGYVPEDELPWLYRGAMMLLFPSWYEGFGMPVIEAMACGTPVVASDIPVLRETGGDAAMFVAPADVPRWTEAIAKLVADPLTGHQLRERGLQRAAAFSFEESARRLLSVWKGCG